MEDTVYFRDSEGNRLMGLLQEISKDVVILVHGFRDKKEGQTASRMREELNMQSISTFRFDMFGHGESAGNFEDLTVTRAADGVVSAFRMLKEMGFERVGVLGVSFGGMAALVAASKVEDFSFLCLKSPVSDYVSIEDKRRDVKKWKEDGFIDTTTKAGKSYRLKYSFYEDGLKNSAYDFAEEISIPCFIVHGDVDTIVPLEQSKKLVSLLPQGTLEIVEGADHWYHGHYFEQVIHLMVDFIIEKFKK